MLISSANGVKWRTFQVRIVDAPVFSAATATSTSYI